MQQNFFKYLSIVFLFALFMLPQNSFAQLTGTKTIPGDYATITAAVTDLNTQGVGAGGVTFNVAAGYTESTTADLTITATGTAGNAIVFQKSGAGANPLVTRTDVGLVTTSSFGADGDAVIRLNGTDYITFNGIDVAASDQGIEYGYYTFKPSGTDGCQFVTITNCVVTMTKGTSAYVMGINISNGPTSASSVTGVTVTAASGINSNITITGNTVQNVHAGIYVRGSSATGFYDSDVIVGQSGAGNTIQNFGGGNVSTTYGVYFIYVNNPSVAYNTINNAGGGGVAHGSTLYGIFYSTVLGDVVGSNNTFTLANTSASSTTQYIYNANTVTSETFNNNTFAAGTISSTGTVYLIYGSNSTPGVSISGNLTSGSINRTGASGSFYCYYNFGSPASGTETITNNNFSNITVAGSSSLYGIYTNTATGANRVCSNNTISNFTGGTGSTYCLYALSTTTNQVNNNNIFGISAGGTVYALYFSGTNPSVYNNNVYNVTTTGSTLYGIYDAGTGTTNCYKNNVYNLTGSNASQTLYGFYITTGTSNNVYNNFVSDLKAPNSASLTGLVGMYVSGGTAIGLYYNTIFLNATSVGANFSASGIYASTTPTVDLRNNIVVNSSTPNGTGLAMAYRRSSTTLTSYSANSSNNSFYAGVPSATNLIYYDGTNSDQTITAFKTRVSPRDAASFSENVPFINSSSAPYNLHVSTSTATQTESGGTPVTTPIAVTDDFDGNTRNATTPDVGADEFAGIGLDLSPPTIVYTPLLNTGSISNRTLAASISDASGVPTAGIGLPRLYWKKGLLGVYTGVTATYLSGTNYQFSFGSGVAPGDTVFYYVVAQDNASTPNVGAVPSASGYTANPPAASTPPASPNGYLITATALTGNYTVGTLFNSISGRNITFEKNVTKVMKSVWVENPQDESKKEKSDAPILFGDKPDLSRGSYQMKEVEEITWTAMENGKPYTGDLYVKKSENPQLSFPDGIEGIYLTLTAAVTDLNLRGVSGPVNFLLNDALYSAGESFPLLVSINNENLPTATNTVTFKPNTSVTATVSGSSTTGIFVSYGTNYVIIDGSNAGGTDRNLTFENTSTAANTYVLGIFNNSVNGSKNNTIKNCVVKAGTNASACWGIILNYNGGGYDNTVIQNNQILRAYTGMQFVGVATGITNGGLVTKNIFGSDTDLETIGNVGMLTSYVDGLVVSENTFKNFKTGTNPKGITVSTSTLNTTISRNLINGIVYTGTGGYGGKGIDINTGSATSNLTLKNNMVSNLSGDGWSTLTSDAIVGIRILGTTAGVNIYHNSVDLSGNADRSSATTSAALYVPATSGFDIRDNIFSNSIVNNTTLTSKAYAIYDAGTNAVFTNINYNDYYAGGSQGVLGYLTADVTDLAGWKTATGQDANSISGDPHFLGSTDLHIDPNFNTVSNNGLYLAAVPVDFDGQARSLTTPDIGADEYTYTPPSVVDPSGVAPTVVSSSQINIAFTQNPSNNNVLIVSNATGTFTPPVGAPPAVGQPFAGGTVVYYGPTSPANHTGLTQNTLYYYKAFSYNGSLYSPGVEVSATTPLGLPFSQDFNAGTTIPAGWVTNFAISATHGAGGTNGLYKNLWSSAPTGNVRSPYMGAVTATTDLTFDYRIVDYSGYPANGTIYAAGNYINVQVSTDNTIWTTLYTIDDVTHVTSNAFVNKQVSLSAYSGSLIYVKFDCQWASGDYYVDFDNVYVGPPLPANPTGFAATPVSSSQIDLAFTPNASTNNVVIVWNLTGTFTAPAGAPPVVGQPFAGGTLLYNGIVSPQSHSSLTENTLYYYKAFSYDGSEYSLGTGTSARTLCSSLTTLTENFDGVTIPALPSCWTKVGTGGSASTQTTNPNSAPNCLYIYSGSTSSLAVVSMPPLSNAGAGTHQLKFKARGNFSMGGILEVGYLTNPSDAASFVSVGSVTVSTLTYADYVIVPGTAPGSNQVLAFRPTGSPAYSMLIDDVQWVPLPVKDIKVASVSFTQASPYYTGNPITVNAVIQNLGSESNPTSVPLTYKIGSAPASQGDGVGQVFTPSWTGNTATVTFTTNYVPATSGVKNIFVNSFYTGDEVPANDGSSNSATVLTAGALWEDFTDVDALARWKVVNLDGGANTWERVTAKFNSSPASAGSNYESSTLQNNDWLISPKLVCAAGDSLTFWHSIQSASFPETMVIKVGTTTNDPTTGTWVDLATIVDNTITWKYKKYDLSAYAGQNIYVAFVNRSLDAFTLFVDDISGPMVYIPAVDLAFTNFYQSSGLPVPRSGEKFSDARISMNVETTLNEKPITKLVSGENGVQASDVNNTILADGINYIPIELNNVSIKSFVKNLGLNAAAYNLAWSVGGVAQTPYSGPSVGVGATDSTVLTFTPTNRGTFITSGNITVTADENPDNDAKQFRMRVYPDVFTRTIYDRGDNIVDTWVGWGPTGTTPFKAGVRFTATSDVKLAGVDFIYRTETLSSADITVQVRAAGTTTAAPGAVLYTAVFNTAGYLPGAGDYITLPFGNDAPTIASGSDYWITVKVPVGAEYPGGVHNTGFTAGRSYFESNTDTTLWNPLVITTERAWIMRSVEVAGGASTFPLTVNVADGWNMVSVPGINPAGQGVSTWWPGRNTLADVYKWTGTYVPVTSATPTEGYWMLHTGANTYNYPAIEIVAHDPIAISTGWNMIGGYENSPLVSGLTTTPAGLIVAGTVYGWNGSYFNPTNLVPGYGYWLLSTGAGVINPPTLAKGTSKLVAQDNKEEWGKITITDAAGKSYVLYAVNGEVNLESYQLPPLPPSGTFDVRYSSGKKAEKFDKEIQTIEMRGITYPVKVRVEKAGIRIQDETGKIVNERLKTGEEITISNSSVSKLMVSADLIPVEYALEQNYPNPFNPSTKIEFSLPEDVNNVTLTIYNALGQRVAELVNSKMEAGQYSYLWNASNVATGMYIYELRTEKFVSVKKMMLLK